MQEEFKEFPFDKVHRQAKKASGDKKKRMNQAIAGKRHRPNPNVEEQRMNFSEWQDSLTDPLYEVNDQPACPKGYKWDKKTMRCVPRSEKDDVTNRNNKDSKPENMSGFNVIGATGLNGDGYAYEEAPTNGGE